MPNSQLSWRLGGIRSENQPMYEASLSPNTKNTAKFNINRKPKANMHRKLKGHLDPLLTSLGCVGIPKVTIHHDPHEAHELTVGTLWKLALMAQLNWMTT